MCFIYIFGLGVFWYFLVINGMVPSADPWVSAWVKLFIRSFFLNKFYLVLDWFRSLKFSSFFIYLGILVLVGIESL